jgi:hypothetical protein
MREPSVYKPSDTKPKPADTPTADPDDEPVGFCIVRFIDSAVSAAAEECL